MAHEELVDLYAATWRENTWMKSVLGELRGDVDSVYGPGGGGLGCEGYVIE